MKNLKKSWIAFLLCLVVTIIGVCFVGCNKNNNTGNTGNETTNDTGSTDNGTGNDTGSTDNGTTDDAGNTDNGTTDSNDVVALNGVVAITVNYAVEGETLLQYMQGLQNDDKITFTLESGMVTSINGTAQAANCYWMLYTSDTENANTAWGTYTYDDKALGSAVLGAESLTVKNGCVYVWVYTQF